jgi:hypothetical protein
MMMFLAAAALALSAAGTGPGEERVFGSWVVACDNVVRCQASAVLPMPDGDSAPDVVLTREPGPAGPVTLVIEIDRTPGRIVDLLIDGRLVATAPLRDGRIQVDSAAAEGLARAMATGHVLAARYGKMILVRLPLAGASATLRYIDDQQGRVGGVTALVARGARSAAAVAPARPVPRIDAVKPSAGVPKKLTAEQLRPLAAQGDCDKDTTNPPPGFYRLDARTTLVMVPCGAGLSSYSHLVFVMQGGKAVPAQFDYPPVGENGAPDPMRPRTPIEVVFSDFTNGVLTHLERPSYPGGCGITQDWVWDGTRFRMTILNRLGVCDKWAMWLTHYRAEPAWRNR